jgi:hypothetical protein
MPLCCGTVHPDDILTSCIKNAYDDQTKSTQDMMHYWYVYPAMTIVTLLPIWLLAWLGIVTIRWIARGFRHGK